MYNIIRTKINLLIAAVNATITGTDNDLKEVDTLLDADNLPANLRNNAYQIKLESVDCDEFESDIFEKVKVTIELFFLIAKARGNYTTVIDTYIRPLKRQLQQMTIYETTSYCINGIEDINITGLNKFKGGGNYMTPSISFNLNCSDIS